MKGERFWFWFWFWFWVFFSPFLSVDERKIWKPKSGSSWGYFFGVVQRDSFLFLFLFLFLSKGTVQEGETPRIFSFTSTEDVKFQEAWERLHRLVNTGGGDIATDEMSQFAGDPFDGSLKRLPHSWSSPTELNVFFPDSFDGDVLVQRF